MGKLSCNIQSKQLHIAWQNHLERRQWQETSTSASAKQPLSSRDCIQFEDDFIRNENPTLHVHGGASHSSCKLNMEKTKRLSQRLDVFHQLSLRQTIGITWKDHINNNTILERAAFPALSEIVTRGCQSQKTSRTMPSKHSNASWMPADGRHRRGRQRIISQQAFIQDL